MVALSRKSSESRRNLAPSRAVTGKPSETRRTEGVRTGGRSARVVESVREATRAALGRAGYAALRIEDVAAESGVNKTTIYRRWPSKAELVADAIRSGRDETEMPDTGTIRGDLVALLLLSAQHLEDPRKIAVLRIFQLEQGNPEVEALGRELRDEHRRPRYEVVRRAVARGELPPSTPVELVVETLLANVYGRITRLFEPVDRAYVEALVDLVLDGARNGKPSAPVTPRRARGR